MFFLDILAIAEGIERDIQARGGGGGGGYFHFGLYRGVPSNT